MNALLPLIAAAGLAAAALPDAGSRPAPEAAPQASGEDDAACRDAIRKVRDERGLPVLQRETASPDAPLLIAAVDQRLGGCRVLVMAHDKRDIRPEPTLPERTPGLMPAR